MNPRAPSPQRDALRVSHDRARRRLFWINVLGGTATLGGYAIGIGFYPELASQLWGETPEAIRPLYTAFMLLATAGYFLFSHVVFFRLHHPSLRIRGFSVYPLFGAIYTLILCPSALWMPLTLWMIAAPSAGVWLAVRGALFAVAAGSLLLLWALLDAPRARGRRQAVLGALFFALQTGVLDALLWPLFFRP